MACILAIETCTGNCSVALCIDGSVAAIAESREEHAHSTLLTLFVGQVLGTSDLDIRDLDAVAVSRGPGSYTGLRIGVSVAKGICYGIDKPFIAVDTLQAMTAFLIDSQAFLQLQCRDNNDLWFCPMIDARRMEVYSGLYNRNLEIKRKVIAEIIGQQSYENYLSDRQIVFFGNGAEKCKEIIIHRNAFFVSDILPSAAGMAKLSEEKFNVSDFENIAYFEPFYLKDFIAKKPVKNLLK
ncbi:MAG: tRNA (adenosine(37)-N6)-threonylcarbamoyltransferase complex dimerization subunit type 1 TsaB [Bacteroidetes bacterium]|nr:tRNA (adenosine(37)-N6)-threonylcarbamoyltransferase complex dimerization subunit type 1 TsaB [Bacteroidota bacterium]